MFVGSGDSHIIFHLERLPLASGLDIGSWSADSTFWTVVYPHCSVSRSKVCIIVMEREHPSFVIHRSKYSWYIRILPKRAVAMFTQWQAAAHVWTLGWKGN